MARAWFVTRIDLPDCIEYSIDEDLPVTGTQPGAETEGPFLTFEEAEQEALLWYLMDKSEE